MWKTDRSNEVEQSNSQSQRPSPAVTEIQSHTLLGVSSNSQDEATIGKSLAITGEVSGSESLYVDGHVEGSINLQEHRVTVGRNGVVSATITAREIVILGRVQGRMIASERLHMSSEGELTGDVVAQRISVEEGAYFKGAIDIRKNGPAKSEISPRESTHGPDPSG